MGDTSYGINGIHMVNLLKQKPAIFGIFTKSPNWVFVVFLEFTWFLLGFLGHIDKY